MGSVLESHHAARIDRGTEFPQFEGKIGLRTWAKRIFWGERTRQDKLAGSYLFVSDYQVFQDREAERNGSFQ